MIQSLGQRLVPGRDEEADELQGHYWELLHRLGSARGNAANGPKTVGVTSCQSGEGVSTIAASLAATAATTGQGPVLLVDANLARPAAHRLLGVKPAPGLAEALAEASPSPALQPSLVVSLTVLAAGDAEKYPARVLAAASIAEMLHSLKDRFLLIVIDMPPVDRGGMTIQLAASLDGVLFVVEAERIRGDEVRQRKDLLARANACLLGVVFNKQCRYVPASLDCWV